MTTKPLHLPPANWAVVKNVVGLLLLVLAVAGVCTAAWFTDWHLGLAVTSAPLGGVGWWLATSEG